MMGNKLVSKIEKNKPLIILFWIIICLIFTVLFTPHFIEKTTTEFSAPTGSDAAEAKKLLEEYFPELNNEISHIVVANNPNDYILGDIFFEFTFDLVARMQQEYNQSIAYISGYYLFLGTELDSAKENFVSIDGSTSIITFQIDAEEKIQEEFSISLRDYIAKIRPDSIEIYTTGIQELTIDTNHSIERDLQQIDAIVLPLVFIALIILLRNWKYFPITIAPIILTILISFGILERYITFFDQEVQTFATSVLVSLVLGVGVDYNLFLLSRFKEERKKGNSVFDSTVIMMNYTGHTIFTSGMTLMIAFAGLIFFPMSIFSSLGFAIAITILILLAINLTFTPAILLYFGNWLESDKPDFKEEANKAIIDHQSTFWYKIGKTATNRNWLILILILIFTIPVAFQTIQSNPQSEMLFFAPRGSDSQNGFILLQDKFNPGTLGPTNIVIVPNDGDIWSQNTFSKSLLFIESLINHTEIPAFSVNSHTWLNGSAVPWILATNLINPISQFYNSSQGKLYRQFSSIYYSGDELLTSKGFRIEILLPVDPISYEAHQYYNEISKYAEEAFSQGFRYGITGSTATNVALIDKTYDLFPYMILFVIIAIYSFVGFMFRAVFLPARLIATIALTIAFIFGMSTVVFEYDTFLNDIFPALNEVGYTFWMLPVMQTSIIVGLGMDYDIFTIERIKENIWNGMDNTEAIAQGISKTGRIITGAGVIMMIAFGGLLFSTSYILIQSGFILAFAILLDTFVVRLILVPAIMSFAEHLNWWPNKP